MEVLKRRVRQALLPMVKIFSKFHPNTLTLIGFIIICFASLLYAKGIFWFGGITLLIGGLFDVIDGEVAKISGKASKFGAFLDSCVDRYEDFIILFGMFIWYNCNREIVPTILVLLAILGSYIISYARARAEGLGYECKVGIGDRAFRIPLIGIGSLLGSEIFIGFLLLLVVVTNATGIYRIWWIWKQTQSSNLKT